MTKLLAALLLLAPLVSFPALAANSQQSKMAACNQQAGGKKGDERKAFMKECLSATPAKTPMTQQEKMSYCNKEATGKKGNERKAFMSNCLKGSS